MSSGALFFGGTTVQLRMFASLIITNEETTMRVPANRVPTHPGEMILEEFLVPLGMSQLKFAEKIGISRVRLNEIIRGKRGVTADTALRLAKALGTSAEFWMNAQAGYDLAKARKSTRLGAIKPIKPQSALRKTASRSKSRSKTA